MLVGNLPTNTLNLMRRRVTTTTIYPQGLGGVPHHDSVSLKDQPGNELVRTETGYDQLALVPSGLADLDTSMGNIRGNETTVTSYRNPGHQPLLGSGSISTHKYFVDTGDVQKTVDANGNGTTMGYDFGRLSATHKTLISSVTSAVITGRQLVTTTATDCSCGLTLRVTDPNGQSTYSQHDGLGRLVETAVPADTLIPIIGFLRDPNIPANRLNGGGVVGNGGQGPTSWTEYLDLGVVFPDSKQRLVAHSKDGTLDGRYVKTFLDGLGRTLQTRSVSAGMSVIFQRSGSFRWSGKINNWSAK
jgi:hypothetical protein